MSYANEGLDVRAEVTQDATDSLVFMCLVDGIPVAPTGTPTVEIRDPNASVLVAAVDTTAGTPTGQRVYTRTWSEATFPLGEDFSAIFSFVSGGITYTERIYFDVVRNRMRILLTPSDLLETTPNLAEHLKGIGLTGTDADLMRFARKGWAHLMNLIRKGGKRPSLILDRARLIEPATEYALAFAFLAMVKRPDDVWRDLAKEHFRLAGEAYSGLGSLRYDIDQDGTTRPGEEGSFTQPKWGV